jgi:malate synthase
MSLPGARRVITSLEIRGPDVPGQDRILTPEAIEFVYQLVRRFGPRRDQLLARRQEVQRRLRAGELPDFLEETADIRSAEWSVAPSSPDLSDRRVEITGPVERKMMINALNSGAKVFMADFEDALSPPWTNVINGQANCLDAVRRTLEYASPEGKRYALGEKLATLVVRPRGWHLQEKHILADGRPVSASLVDFGLYFFHNARELLARGSGPYFYLPKLENHLEARLWNEVFDLAQDALGIPRGTGRATVLIETILAAYEMDEILYELRDHAAGLNAGRWDYLFSIIKNFRDRPDFLLPDRSQLTMTVPFMRAYTELLVKTCHRRGAHAIGGMAAFIPSRRDPQVNATALARVREDKTREARAGYDGAWVAHPDLVPVVDEVFGAVLQKRPNQKERQRDDVDVKRDQLLDVRITDGRITEAGVRGNISVALQYLAAWLGGSGAVAINNLMEDAATAEIARSQLWQWIRHEAINESGKPITLAHCRRILNEERATLEGEGGDRARLGSAAELLDSLISAEEFPEFLTLSAYQRL